MNIDVKGHSGCSIDVIRDGRSLYVVKATSDPKYFDRLVLQARKQQEASLPEYQHIRVPKVHDVIRSNDEVSVKMDYVYSKNFVEYFEHAGFEQIDYLISALLMYLDREIEESPMQSVAASTLTDKFEDVCRKTLSNPSLQRDIEIRNLLDRSAEAFQSIGDMQLPVGKCHGDLTFSNILLNGNNYYLIDFLDSFIESPLLDIVKVRQDTAWRWSQLMYVQPFDKVRLKIICDKIDRDIDSHFRERHEWYRNYYSPMQLMNFLRILQYAHEPKVIDYLENVISSILEENS